MPFVSVIVHFSELAKEDTLENNSFAIYGLTYLQTWNFSQTMSRGYSDIIILQLKYEMIYKLTLTNQNSYFLEYIPQ